MVTRNIIIITTEHAISTRMMEGIRMGPRNPPTTPKKGPSAHGGDKPNEPVMVLTPRAAKPCIENKSVHEVQNTQPTEGAFF